MGCLRLLLAVLCGVVMIALPARAQLVINEFSNGTTGSEEYVELLVIGTPTCTNSCVDLRGWIIDDNNGDFGPTGVAAGHMRFAQSSVWECVPIGTIIVVYNDGDRNAAIPPDNLTGTNCVYIVPASSTLFDRNTTGPSTGTGATYPVAGTSGGNWTHLGMNNTSDTYQTRDPNNITVPYHSVGYGDNSTASIIYFPTAGTGSMYYMTNSTSDDPFLQANWVQGTAAANQTPGAANNPANAAWIASLNNNCTPITGATVDLGADVAICSGESVTVTATANIPGTFTWNVPGSGNSVTLTPNTNTTVIVNFDGGAGCVDADTMEITINASPIGSITPANIAICAGESTTLTASGGASYLWSTTEVTPAITVSPTNTTVYTLTVTNAGGCTDTVSATVTVNPAPTGSITGDTAICAGGSTTLTASGGNSYQWSTTEVTPAITVSPASTTPYSVTVTAAGGCRDTVTTTVTVNPAPTAAIAGNTTICAGGSTTLTASGGTSYVWSTTDATPSITVSPVTNTTYDVTVTDANGCTATASITVNVTASISGSITGNLTVCAGQSTTLTASGGNTYLWSTSENTAAITVSPTTNTVYSVTVTSGTCNDTVTETVTVNPAAVGAISGTTIICAGESTTLTASGGASYQWSTSDITPSITVSPIANTTYTVTVTAANGCLDTVSVTVTVSALPVADAGPTQIVCEGSSAALTASGGGTYLWSTTETTASISVSPSVTTDYIVTVTNAGGCTDADTVTVTVNPNNMVLAVDSIWAETCEQGNGRIVLESPSNFVTYVLIQNGVRIDSVLGGGVFFDLTGGTYDVIATDNNGCQRTLTGIVVPASAVPQATVSAVSPNCFGDANGSITLTSTTSGLYYSLNGGTPQQGSTFSGLVAGDYNIRVIDSVAGCDNIIDYTLTQPDALSVTVSPDSSNIITGNTVELVSTVSGGNAGYTYQWVPSNGLDCDTCANVLASPVDSMNVYILTVTDTNGCVDTARAVVRVSNEFLITVPSGFTPNGDGWNDFLRPLANEPIDFYLMVFNRWGEKIYEGDGMPGWDGTYKHEPQPISTYVYVIEYTRLLNGAKGYLTGSFTLLR